MKNLRLLVIVLFSMTLHGALHAQQPVLNISDPRLDFKVADLKGDFLKLSSLKGKVFLLDFWASWCGPCRITNRHLVKLYSKYKTNGFEIFSVSLDEHKNKWKKAVTKDKLTWLHGKDSGDREAFAAAKWNIDAIPASFLIGKNGNVVAFNLEKDGLEKKIKELLGLL